MAERPILFSGPLVRAILAGRKTETRRLITKGTAQVSDVAGAKASWTGLNDASRAGASVLIVGGGACSRFIDSRIQPGDTLWVRETHGVVPASLTSDHDPKTGEGCRVLYRATDGEPDPGTWENWKWTPSIYMRPWASRIRLRVLDVQAERLQEIDGYGVLAEGIDNGKSNAAMGVRWEIMQRMAFERLWDEINGKREGAAWSDDPWVWVYKFEVEEPKR